MEHIIDPNMSTGPVDIYEVKRSQRYLLTAIENNQLGIPILSECFARKKYSKTYSLAKEL